MRRTITTLLATLALLATGVVAGLAAGGTGTVDPPPRIAFLANGIVPADALAAGGIAGQLGAPLFTTPADTLNGDAAAGIDAYDPDLVIVLGGPVAITDDVVAALATATGLAVTTADAPTDGIVRVAGGDRFATARAVADLLAAYDPAYLPVDATALGAVDADTIGGLGPDAFARSDQACDPGDLVTAVDADGVLLCTTDEIDGGDAATLDGIDSGQLLRADQVLAMPSQELTVVNTVGNVTDATLLEFDVPAAGAALIDVSFACISASGTTDTRWNIITELDGQPTHPSGLETQMLHTFSHGSAGNPGGTSSFSTVTPVAAGTRTLTYDATRSTGNGSLDCNIYSRVIVLPGVDTVQPASRSAPAAGVGLGLGAG